MTQVAELPPNIGDNLRIFVRIICQIWNPDFCHHIKFALLDFRL